MTTLSMPPSPTQIPPLLFQHLIYGGSHLARKQFNKPLSTLSKPWVATHSAISLLFTMAHTTAEQDGDEDPL